MDNQHAAAISELKRSMGGVAGVTWKGSKEWREKMDSAIAALEQAERWEGVIEQAGKVDKYKSIKALEDVFAFAARHGMATPDPDIIVVLNLVRALPEPPEGGKAG